MKKIIFVILALLVCANAWAIDKDTAIIASETEQAYGRNVTFNESELVTIWYTGSGAGSAGV